MKRYKIRTLFEKLTRGVLLLVLIGIPYISFYLFCLQKIINGEGLNPYVIFDIHTAKPYGAGATYLTMFISLNVILSIPLIVLLIKYFSEKDERDFKKKYRTRIRNEN